MKSPAQTIAIIAGCRFGEAVAVGMLVPVLPSLLVRWAGEGADAGGIAKAQTTLLFSAFGIAMAIGQILSARWSDRIDRRKPFVVIGLFGSAALSAAFISASSFEQLLPLRLVQGVSAGLTFPPLMAIIAHYSPSGRAGRALGFYVTLRLIGFAIGPLIGGVVSDSAELRGLDPFDATFGASAVLLFLSVALVMALVPDARQRASTKPKRISELPRVPGSLRVVAAALFVAICGVTAVISLFPIYEEEFGATRTDLGLVFSAFLGARAVLQFPLGWFADRFDKKLLLTIALLALGPLIALQGFATSMTMLCVIRAGLGAAVAAVSAAASGIAAERSVPGNRARVMGTNTLSFSLAQAVGPLLTGLIPDPRLAFGSAGLAAFLILTLVWVSVPSDRDFRLVAAPAS